MGLFVVIAALSIMLIFFALYSYRVCFYAPRKKDAETDMESWFPKGKEYTAVRDKMIAGAHCMEDSPYEWVGIRSWDGTKLWGRYYHLTPGAPLMIVFHGYRGFSSRDCAGAFVIAAKMGLNVLAIDQRSHGQSEGNVITFGIRERKDCLCWIEYAKSRFGDGLPILIYGVSMGAATVLMASELALPENVACIIADCPYTSPSDIIRKVAAEMGFPDALAYPILRLGARLFGHFSLTESSALEAVKLANVPILLIHGEDDHLVPCRMSRMIYDNCKDIAQLHTFPEAGHGLSYPVDPRHYEKICVDFLWQIDALHPFLDHSEFAKKLHSA